MNRSENIHIRCTPEFKERIKELAKREHRSVSQQIISVVEEALDRAGIARQEEIGDIYDPP